MRRSIFIPVALLLLASGIVAIVKAQDWSGVAGTQSSGQAPVMQNQFVTQASAVASSDNLPNQPQSIRSDNPAEPAALPAAAIENANPIQATQLAQPIRLAAAIDESTAQIGAAGGLRSSRRKREPAPEKKPAATPQPIASPQPSTPSLPVETPQTLANIQRKSAQEEPEASIPQPPQSIVDPPRASVPQRRLTATRTALTRPRVSEPSPSDEPATPAGNALMTSRGPAIRVTTTGPRMVTIGKQSEYVIQVKNEGSVDANDLSVMIELPQWADVSNTNASRGTARYETTVGQQSRLRWNIAQIEASGSETLTLDLTATESRPFDLAVGWTFLPVLGRSQIEVQEPKLHMTLTGPREVLFGETRVYTITVSNPGTGDAEDVVVQLAPTVGQAAAGKSEIGTLAAGDRKVIEVELTARQAGELQIMAEAFAAGGLKSQANEVVRVRRADIDISLEGPEIKYAGTVAAYQMRVANTGDATADTVVAAAALPRGAQFVSSTDAGEYDESQGRIDWRVGSLRPGGVKMLEFRCILGEAGANRVEVAAAAKGEIGATTSTITTVEALADLKLIVNDPKGPLPVGEPIVYEVHIINRGTKAAEGINLKSFFSEGIEPVSVEGGAAEIGAGTVLFREIPRLAAGQQVVMKISALASQPGAHVFRAELESTSPETVLAQQETTRFYGNAVASSQTTEAVQTSEEEAPTAQAVETAEPSLPPRLR